MREYVKLYLGPSSDMKGKDEDFMHRAKFISAEPTRAPADIASHYDVEVTVESKSDGNKYKTEINSRTINNWLTKFEDILEEELESDDGLDGQYVGKERNARIVEILSKLVPMWINTKKAEKID